MKVTRTAYEVTKLESAIVALENLDSAGILFYGSNLDAIDNAKLVLQRELTEAMPQVLSPVRCVSWGHDYD